MIRPSRLFLAVTILALLAPATLAKEIRIPTKQSAPPGPAKSPQEALEAMTTLEGFEVRLAASEPDLINPVAMAWDDRGRAWVCESVEYPRFEPGIGEDRIRIHEDTNRDGVTDSVKTFVGGLNIPSGIAIGYGGVFVANAPDLLFYRDINGDDIADSSEVLVTGFGRTDTHEGPNSLVWGPDGWLYGLNGVFNHSKVAHKGETYKFTCAVWRYHPIRKDFELFCEGTSNPWGLDYNRNGHWFVSACVIDHLWHLTQTGYYHRQSGAYPPNVWKNLSISQDYIHPWHAHCGLSFYDADVYPEEHLGRMFMGNVHQGAVNSDSVVRNGATYKGAYEGDLLNGNDIWCLPTVTTLGPDGCLWVLDWYDRYHCYQDARRDPDGIDRAKGRFWRVVHGESPMPEAFNLQEYSDEKLVETLSHPNRWWRRKARRILTERDAADVVPQLEELALSEGPHNGPVEALWTLIGLGRVSEETHLRLFEDDRSVVRLWAVRAASEKKRVTQSVFEKLLEAAHDESADVRVQVAVASSRVDHPRAFELVKRVMEHADPDVLIPHIAWENIHPVLDKKSSEVTTWLVDRNLGEEPVIEAAGDRLISLILETDLEKTPRPAQKPPRWNPLSNLLGGILPGFCPRPGSGDKDLGKAGSRAPNFERLLEESLSRDGNPLLAQKTLGVLWEAMREGRAPDRARKLFGSTTNAEIARASTRSDRVGRLASFVLAAWNDSETAGKMKRIVASKEEPAGDRADALSALVLAEDAESVSIAETVLRDGDESPKTKAALLNRLRSVSDDLAGERVIETWDALEGEARTAALTLLSSRPAWSNALLAAVESVAVPTEAMNQNVARRIVQHRDEELTARLEKVWGRVRENKDDRKGAIRKVQFILSQDEGDAARGMRVFKDRCLQCHVIYGEGREVGPDLTAAGRTDLKLVLSNVIDPNLVIGQGYLSHTVWMTDGQIFNGLLVEDTDAQVTLKLEGAEMKSIPGDEIEEIRESELSLMPEGLEEGLTEQQVRDLFAFLMTREAPVPWEEVLAEAPEETQSE